MDAATPAQLALASWQQAREQQRVFNDATQALQQQDVKKLQAALARRAAPAGAGNGRVALLPLPSSDRAFPDEKVSWEGEDEQAPAADSYAHQVMKSMNLDENMLASVFFGRDNLEALQTGMRNRVLNDSQGRYSIGRQSEVDLLILMRAAYADHARHDLLVPVTQQVRELNAVVLDKAVRLIIAYIKQDKGYQRDASTLPELLDRPTYMSSYGKRFFAD